MATHYDAFFLMKTGPAKAGQPDPCYGHVDTYNSEVFALKSACRIRENNSRDNLRDLFNDMTRSDPSAHKETFK